MASENNFQNTVDSLFKGMDSFVTTKTVVGDAITVGDTISSSPGGCDLWRGSYRKGRR